MVSLILVGTPKDLNIPYFAMGASESRKSGWSFIEFKKCKAEDISGNAYRWILEREKPGDIRLIQTRNYLPPKTAFYAYWLAFPDAVLAHQFTRRFPRYDTAAQIVRLNAETEKIASQIQEKTAKGAFDLSRLPSEQRRGAADRFIEADQKLHALHENIRLLGMADSFREDWTYQIQSAISSAHQG